MQAIEYRPFAFIPVGDATEMHGEHAWRQWDRAVIDLDALKAAGLNSAEESARLLRAHQERERLDLALELERKLRGGR